MVQFATGLGARALTVALRTGLINPYFIRILNVLFPKDL
jgi:hypothetical protein